MMQSVIYREIMAEGELRGEQRGEQHGRLAVVERLLKRRFGLIPPRVQTQITALTSPELEQLSEALLDFKTVGDLIFWLENQPS
jgi:predicted transposase YdaD